MRLPSILIIPKSFILVLALTTGCARIIPEYPAEMAKSYAEGYKLISEIVAKVELGELGSASSYPKTVDQYAKAIAAIETAKMMALGLSEVGGTSQTASDNIAQQMKNCLDAIKDMAELHKLGDLEPNSGAQIFRLDCSNAFLSLGGEP